MLQLYLIEVNTLAENCVIYVGYMLFQLRKLNKTGVPSDTKIIYHQYYRVLNRL